MLDQLEKDQPEPEKEPIVTRGTAATIQGQIQKDIEQLVGATSNGRHGKDLDTL